ncbi:MAG: TfoX/Sxy family protein [Blastocatellia bacterium]
MTEEKSDSGLRNIGPVSIEWLRTVGISSRKELEAIGSIEAYRLVRAYGFNASLNLLYALEAALQDIHWTALSPQTKAKLKAAARLL